MNGDMTVKKLLTLDNVKDILTQVDGCKEDIEELVVIYCDNENNVRRIATPMPLLLQVGLLDLVKLQTLDECFVDEDDEQEPDNAV